MVKNMPAMQETWVWSLGQEDPLEKGMAPCSTEACWALSREIHGQRSPAGYGPQSRIKLDTTEQHLLFTWIRAGSFFLSEKTMAPHSSTLAWKIPWTEEPGRLQSMRSLRVGHDWATSLLLFTFMHWRRKWQPTPMFLPGESQGRGSLVGCRLWGCTELDTTEAT